MADTQYLINDTKVPSAIIRLKIKVHIRFIINYMKVLSATK